MQISRMVTLAICATALFHQPTHAAAASAVTAQQSAPSSMQQEMIDLQKTFVEAQERGDAEYLKNALADDFVSIEPNGEISGKQDLLQGIHPPEQPGPPPILYDFGVIKVNETCAIVTYKAVFAGSRVERYQHLSDTWVEQDGKWKLKFQQSTLNLWSAEDAD